MDDGFVARQIIGDGHGVFFIMTYGEGSALAQVFSYADNEAEKFWAADAVLIESMARESMSNQVITK